MHNLTHLKKYDRPVNTRPEEGRNQTNTFGFDRIEIWTDRAELPLNEARLKNHCAELTTSLEQMPQNARWKLKITICQPTVKCLQLLLKAFAHDVGQQLSYVEIACDIKVLNKSQAQRLRNSLLGALYLPNQRQPVMRFKTTWYYGRRTSNGKRRGSVFVLYADRPSKLNNMRPNDNDTPCLHIEWRATGRVALQKIGLATLADLIEFDHHAFWAERLHVCQLPSKTALGRWLEGSSGTPDGVGNAALRKRTRSWQNDHQIKGKFVLQNALQKTPHLKRKLRKKDFWAWMLTAYETACE